jgi:hypothetical protein
MAIVNIFETIRARVEQSGGLLPQERRAMFWFSQYSAALKNWQKGQSYVKFKTLKDGLPTQAMVAPQRAFPGHLYFFYYEPIGKKTLPAYDTFPLTLVVKREADGFIGLNFHYLSYLWRARLFDVLYDTLVQENPNPLKTRLFTTYKMLNSVTKYKAFRPCLKRYRFSQCRTPLLQVGETDWDLALFLPVEQFQKSVKADVWQESAESISERKR